MKNITVFNKNGTTEEVELVSSFMVKDLNRNFVVLSKGEMIKEGISKVYVTEIVQKEPGVFELKSIEDESVWDKVKMAMKEIVQGA